MTFHRCYKLSWISSVYGGDAWPKLIRCEVVADFIGHETTICYIAWGPFSGLRRYTFL